MELIINVDFIEDIDKIKKIYKNITDEVELYNDETFKSFPGEEDKIIYNRNKKIRKIYKYNF